MVIKIKSLIYNRQPQRVLVYILLIKGVMDYKIIPIWTIST